MDTTAGHDGAQEPSGRARPWYRRRRWPILGIVVVGLLVLLGWFIS